MSLRPLSLGAGLGALALFGFAALGHAGDDTHAVAIKACTGANAHQPAKVVTAIDDGRGGSLV